MRSLSDLDYCRSIGRKEMLADRAVMTGKISKYMTANGYASLPCAPYIEKESKAAME